MNIRVPPANGMTNTSGLAGPAMVMYQPQSTGYSRDNSPTCRYQRSKCRWYGSTEISDALATNTAMSVDAMHRR